MINPLFRHVLQTILVNVLSTIKMSNSSWLDAKETIVTCLGTWVPHQTIFFMLACI